MQITNLQESQRRQRRQRESHFLHPKKKKINLKKHERREIPCRYQNVAMIETDRRDTRVILFFLYFPNS